MTPLIGGDVLLPSFFLIYMSFSLMLLGVRKRLGNIEINELKVPRSQVFIEMRFINLIKVCLFLILRCDFKLMLLIILLCRFLIIF
jgi:hypothetical protein